MLGQGHGEQLAVKRLVTLLHVIYCCDLHLLKEWHGQRQDCQSHCTVSLFLFCNDIDKDKTARVIVLSPCFYSATTLTKTRLLESLYCLLVLILQMQLSFTYCTCKFYSYTLVSIDDHVKYRNIFASEDTSTCIRDLCLISDDYILF